ncbi:MAG: NTP transferase domain-containing protein [Candidatus Nomurabacteria bacterium]|jgi:UTP--glucose-1-phosphate uridylyltransferase|nr:NTP transferase domain-containing protein [Candidatus Nomurabacteria bacterium]
MKTPTKAIIADAGFASRYLPITKTIPKSMLPFGNRPIMQLLVEECIEAGIEEIIIVATAEGRPIYEDYFNNSVNHIRKQLIAQGKEDRYEAVQHVLDFPKITVIEQDPSLPYGTAAPIISARDYLSDDEAFITMQADDVVFGPGDVKTLIESYEKHPDAKGIMIAQEVDPSVVNKYGIIVLKNGDQLDYIVEKPAVDAAPSNLASYGRFLHTPEIFKHFDETGLDDELWQVDGVTKMAKDGAVYVEKTRGQWMTTGDPKNYFLAHLRFNLDSEDWRDEIRELVG